MVDSPRPAVIRKFRDAMGYTQAEAASFVHVTPRAWQMWEAGTRAMPPAVWELSLIKAGMHPNYGPTRTE